MIGRCAEARVVVAADAQLTASAIPARARQPNGVWRRCRARIIHPLLDPLARDAWVEVPPWTAVARREIFT
jgi:hypothetical protein